MGATEKRLAYIAKYNKEKCKTYCIRLSYANNKDVIEFLEKEGKVQTTFLKAIRKMMKEEAGE